MTPSEERNQALLEWYHTHRRELPWRRSHDPYGILVAEVMLQQTQVDRVVPYYERFMARYPTVADLADARTDELLALWSGLGYNNRAIRLRESARRVVGLDWHSRGWPTDPGLLQQLPGVGPYTAAAIASIAFGVPAAAVDTNLRRVLSRWFGVPLAGSELLGAAGSSLDHRTPGDWNQAVMDLGATICRPSQPDCTQCPVETWCPGPDVYTPPPLQSRFEGSVRKARGRVVRLLVEQGQASEAELRSVLSDDGARLDRALTGLVADGLVRRSADGHYQFVD